jgi:predicted ATP-grasp superfamily ATP-dependent carboligase
MKQSGSVFLFEYARCSSGSLSPGVAVEGFAMFKVLYGGFERPFSFYNRKDYLESFKRCLDISDYAIAIAPETDLKLYRLTDLIEDSGSGNLGCSSRAVKTASDKLLTYKRLRDLSPKTQLFKGKTNLSFPMVAKPRDGVSGEGVTLLRDEGELEKVPKNFLVQEFVEGKAMSASVLVGEEIRILSINTQEMSDFQYTGAMLPIDFSDTEHITEAVHRVPGLFGYVGVDFVLEEGVPKILEINPRPTTPIIGLNPAFDINVSDLILKNYHGKTIPDAKPKRVVQIKKSRSSSGFVSHGGYSLDVSVS